MPWLLCLFFAVRTVHFLQKYACWLLSVKKKQHLSLSSRPHCNFRPFFFLFTYSELKFQPLFLSFYQLVFSVVFDLLSLLSFVMHHCLLFSDTVPWIWKPNNFDTFSFQRWLMILSPSVWLCARVCCLSWLASHFHFLIEKTKKQKKASSFAYCL